MFRGEIWAELRPEFKLDKAGWLPRSKKLNRVRSLETARACSLNILWALRRAARNEIISISRQRTKSEPLLKPGYLQKQSTFSPVTYKETSTPSHWQIFGSYSVHFHIWRRADSDVTISKFVLFCPSYMFMLQIWSVPLERTKNWKWVTCTTECESSLVLIFNWTVIYYRYGAQQQLCRRRNHSSRLRLFATRPQTLCVFVTTFLKEFYHPDTSSPTTHFCAPGSGGKSPPDWSSPQRAASCWDLHAEVWLLFTINWISLKHSCFFLIVCF